MHNQSITRQKWFFISKLSAARRSLSQFNCLVLQNSQRMRTLRVQCDDYTREAHYKAAVYRCLIYTWIDSMHKHILCIVNRKNACEFSHSYRMAAEWVANVTSAATMICTTSRMFSSTPTDVALSAYFNAPCWYVKQCVCAVLGASDWWNRKKLYILQRRNPSIRRHQPPTHNLWLYFGFANGCADLAKHIARVWRAFAWNKFDR